MTFTTAFFFGLVVVCMILACFDYSPTPHHSHYQKRRKGKFAKELDQVEKSRVEFEWVDARTLRRVQ